MINLYSDLTYKGLYKQLLKLLEENNSHVFLETWIIVPNHSAKQWLQKSIARDLGICAQVNFILPLSFNWEVLKNVVKRSHDINFFSSDVFRWLIFERINNKKKYQHLKQDSDIKNFNLSEKIALTLLKYNDEHPDVIAKWDEGIYELPVEIEWQVELWLEILAQLETQSPVQLLKQFDPKRDFKQTPEKVIFFATEQITTFQKDTLFKLSLVQDINVFLSNPCPQDYWFDLKPAASKARAELFNVQLADIIDVGNPLLANLGYNKMALFDTFLSNETDIQESNSIVLGDSLLQSLKQDVYALSKAPTICVNDNSISIHSCHSKQREIEIIKDEILLNLDNDESLNPEDIIVLAPDINDYVQSIKLTFDNQDTKNPIYLPFHIDRVQMADAHYISALMKILASFSTDMSAPVIYDLLTQSSIMQKFNIDENDLPRLKNWITHSNIRNFYSAKHKSSFNYEEKIGNTWQFGQYRWLSGYLAGDVDAPYLSTYGDIAGQEQIFAHCFDFLGLWFKNYEFSQENHSPQKWYAFLQGICHDFLYNDFSQAWEEKVLKQLENKFIAQPLNCPQTIPLVVIENIVKTVITENTFRSEGQIGVRFQTWENAFITDAKLLIILGLNDNEFPKIAMKDDLDIFKDKPAKLNKSTRGRDKNLMLTALTENAQKLIFTYVGFDTKTNDEQPPSVILAELIAYLQQKTNQGFNVQIDKMHGFNKHYFSNEIGSYNHKNYKIAQSLYSKHKKSALTQIQLSLEPEKSIALNDLCKFFIDPLDYFLKTRAKIDHPIYENILLDTETYFPTGLETWQLKNEIFNYGKSTAAKTGIVSDNITGQALLAKYDNELGLLHSYVKDLTLKTHVIDCVNAGFNVFGNIDIDEKHRLISVFPSKINAKNLCQHWIKHLCYESKEPSYAHFEDKSILFSTPEDYQSLLSIILQKWSMSYTQPWLFCPNKVINAKLKKINVLKRSVYLKQFIESNNTFPSKGQTYFLNQVEGYDEQANIEDFILPLIQNIECIDEIV